MSDTKHPNDKTLSEIKKSFESRNVVPIAVDPELSKIKPITYSELMSELPMPVENILHPWLPKQGIAFIYAATGVGKTLFTLNVAYAIADGGNFLKYKCPQPRKILYVDGEMAYQQMHSRIVQITKQQGELSNHDNFHLLNPDKAHPFKLPKICDPIGQKFYNKLIEELKIEVLILDNLSTLSAIDENKGQEWGVIQDWLLSLKSKGLSIIIVHHSGKEKNGYRGTSRMLDCIDTAISLQDLSDGDFEADKANSKKFKIVYQKNRTFGGQDSLSFEVKLTHASWQFESLEKNNTLRIVEMFEELGLKPNDIAAELNINKTHVYRVIKKARGEGLIRK